MTRINVRRRLCCRFLQRGGKRQRRSHGRVDATGLEKEPTGVQLDIMACRGARRRGGSMWCGPSENGGVAWMLGCSSVVRRPATKQRWHRSGIHGAEQRAEKGKTTAWRGLEGGGLVLLK
jgi:hypothetical protein